MKKILCTVAVISVAFLPGMAASAGGVPMPHRAAPTLEQRVADLEAYLKAIGVTLVLAIASTTVIAYIVKALVGLRPTEEVETIGLDLAEHGEEGYHG
jgi:ammonia channel protein AmtB